MNHHVSADGTADHSIEVFNAVGETLAVTAVPSSALKLLREEEILCALSITG